MILVDTSVWVDYFGRGDSDFKAPLNRGNVLIHPFVIGELAVGTLRDREATMRQLQRLLLVATATDTETLRFIARYRLFGLDIGYVDCHLLASVMLTPGTKLLTRDRRLSAAASRLGVAANSADSLAGPN